MGKSKRKKERKNKEIKVQENTNIEEKEIKEPVKLKEETSVKIIVISGESYFDGSFIGLLAWKLLGYIITIITFGLAHPFALCMRYNWQTKHTVVNGKRLKFDGHGYQLIGKWIWWWILTIITFGLYYIFIPAQKRKWIVKHTHYENYDKDSEEDENNKSKFTGSIFAYVGWSLLTSFIAIFSFGLLLPVSICLMKNFQIKHTTYDGEELEFTGDPINLLLNCLKWIGLTLITFGLYSFVIETSVIKWTVKNIVKKGVSKKVFSTEKYLLIPLLISFISFIVVSIFAYPLIDDYIDSIKEEIDYIIQDEVYTGQDWGDKYALYLKHHILDDVLEVRVAIVNVDESSSPELFINYTNKDKENITKFLYIKDKTVQSSRNYKNAEIKLLCTVEDEEYKWAIFTPEKESENGKLYFTDKLMEEDFEKIEYKKEDKEFQRKYVMRNINLIYYYISKDELHNDMNALIGNYEGDNYITSSVDNEFKKAIEAERLEIENLKRLQVGDYYAKYGTYKLYTNGLHSRFALEEDDEIFELKAGGVCHIKRTNHLGNEVDKDCTYQVADSNYIIDSKKIATINVTYEGGNTNYQVKDNNVLTNSWYTLKLK